MQIKLSFLGYTLCGVGLSMFLGFIGSVSPISQYVWWLVGLVVACCCAAGLLNFAGLIHKGFNFSQKTFLIGMLPGFVLAVGFLVLVGAGVSLGVR